MRFLPALATLLTAALLPLGAAGQIDPFEHYAAPGPMDRLPPGLTRTVLERMTPDEREATLRSAQRDLERLDQLQSGTSLSDAALARATEEVLAVAAARQAIGHDPNVLRRLSTRLRLAGDVVPAAPPLIGAPVLGWDGVDAAKVSLASQILKDLHSIRSPLNPKDDAKPPQRWSDRLVGTVDRPAYRSVVGIGRRLPGGKIEFYCSGLLIAPTVVVTAAHCTEGAGGPKDRNTMVVLSQFTGGTESVVRGADQRAFKGVSVHPVASATPHPRLDRSVPNRWAYDVAIIKLAAPVALDAYSGVAKGIPKPLKLTAGGWGKTDAEPVNDVALELTLIEFRGGAELLPVPPAMLTFERNRPFGGSVCRGDSGGPVFAGTPDKQGRASMLLVGLTASGDVDCTGGAAYLTDMTTPENRNFVCAHAAGSAYCA